MSDTVSLGTISASAGLDLRPMQTAVKEAGKLLSGLSEMLKGVGEMKFSGVVPGQIAEIGEVSEEATGKVSALRTALKSLNADLGLKPVAEQITRIGVNAVQSSGGLDDLATGLKLVKNEGAGVSESFVGVKDTLKEVRDAAGSGATAFGRLTKGISGAGEAGKTGAEGISAAGDAAEGAGGAAEAAAAGFGALRGELSGVAGAGNRAAIALERASRAGKTAGGLGAARAAETTIVGGRRGRPMAPAERGGMLAAYGMPLLKGGGILAEIMAAAGLGAGAYSSSFDVKAQHVMGNTTLTAAQRDAIKKQILARMKAGSPVSEDQFFGAYMAAANFGYTGQRSDKLIGIAEAMGVGTGAPTDKQAEILGGLSGKNAFNIPDNKLQAFAEANHVTAAGSNMTLEEFSKRSSKSMGFAASYRVKPEQALAMFSSLVQAKIPAAQVDTQLAGFFNTLAAPQPKTIKTAMAIEKKSGVDLLPFMGVAGLAKNQPTGFLDALKRSGASRQDIVNLFPNQRGRLAALKLTDNYQTFQDKLYGPQGTATAMNGRVHNIDALRAAMMAQPGIAAQSELQKTKATAYIDGKPLQKDLSDIIHLLGKAARAALDAATAFSALPKSLRQMIEGAGLVGLGARLLGAPAIGLRGRLGGAEVGARGAFPGLAGLFGRGAAAGAGAEVAGGAEAATGAEGVAAVAGASGVAAVAVPLAIATAAVVAFGAAWATNFGQIRQTFKPFLDDIRQTFGGSGKEISGFIGTTLPNLKKFVAEIEPLFKKGFEILAPMVKLAFDVLKFVIRGALAIVGGLIRTALALVTLDWKGAWEGVKDIFKGIWSAIVGLASDLSPKFVAQFAQLGTDIKKGFLESGEQIKKGFLESGAQIKEGWIRTIAELKTAFRQSGQDLIQQFSAGLTNGLTSARTGITSAAKSLGSLLPEGVKDILEIHSPSRVMHRIGQDTGQGLINGILSKKAEASAAAKQIAEAAAMGVIIKPESEKKPHKTEAERHAEALAKAAERKQEAQAKVAERKQEAQAKVASRVNLADDRAAVTGPMSPYDKQRMAAVFRYQDHVKLPGVSQAGAFAGLSGTLTGIDAREEDAVKRHAASAAKHLASIQQAFTRFVAGLSGMTASALAKTAKATKAPDALADARDARIGANGDEYGQQLATIESAKKAGAASPEQAAAAIKTAQGVYMDRYRAAWDEYTAAVKAESDKAAKDAGALEAEIARATAHAAGHVWKDSEAQAREYFQGLRDSALATFSEVETRIDQTPNLTDDQKKSLHDGNKGTYQATVGDLDLQETDAATKRKLDSLKTQFSQAQDAFSQDDNKQAFANTLGQLRGNVPQDGSLASADFAKNVDEELKRLSKDGKSTTSELGRSVIDSLGGAFDQAIGHAKKVGSAWKEIMQSMKLDAKSIFLSFIGKEFKDGLLSLFSHKEKGVTPQGSVSPQSATGQPSQLAPLLGGLSATGLFSGTGASAPVLTVPNVAFYGGTSTPRGLAALSGLGGLPAGNLLNTSLPGLGSLGMAMPQIQGINGAIGGFGQGGPMGALSGISSLAPLLAHGGALGGILGHGGLAGMFAHGGLMTSGGALGGFGAALPWIGGGLALNSLLGNPFGKLFKKWHLFSGGGIVPGHGFHDTVPAMLKPGEVVLNHEQQKMQGQQPHINIVHNGNVYGAEGVSEMHQDWAWGVSQHLATAVPGD